MILAEVEPRDFNTYFADGWAVVRTPEFRDYCYIEGLHDGMVTVRTTNSGTHNLARDDIESIEAPTLGYHGIGNALVFSTRTPARTTRKSLCATNTSSTLCPDMRGLGVGMPRTRAGFGVVALMQPVFREYVPFAAALTLLQKAAPYAVLNGRVALSLNSIDGHPDVWSNLWVNGRRIGGLNVGGETVVGDPALVRAALVEAV